MRGSVPFFFLPSLLVADNIHNSRAECSEAVSYTNDGPLPILLLPAFCFYRTAHDLGLGVNCVSCVHNWHCCNDERLPRLPERQPRRRSKKLRSVTSLASVVVAPVDERARNPTTRPTRLHHKSKQYQRDSGFAAMDVSVILLSRDGCVTGFCRP